MQQLRELECAWAGRRLAELYPKDAERVPQDSQGRPASLQLSTLNQQFPLNFTLPAIRSRDLRDPPAVPAEKPQPPRRS